MGKRVKKEIQTVRVDTDNPILKRLESLSQHRRNVANGSEELSAEEKRDLVAQQEMMMKLAKDFESIKNNPLFKRGKWMDDIASATNVSAIDVSKMIGDYWGFPLLSDEELEQAARDANNIYQEIETELNFDSKLSREQIEILLPVMNEFVFAEALSSGDVQRLLDCSLVNPVRVKNNRTLAFFLSQLSGENLICSNWAQVAELSKSFVSSRGTEIKASNLTTSLARYLVQEDERTKEIKDWIISVVERCKG